MKLFDDALAIIPFNELDWGKIRKAEDPASAMMLLMFYRRKSFTLRCPVAWMNTEAILNGTGLSNAKYKAAKRHLMKEGLISSVVKKSATGKVLKWYVKVNAVNETVAEGNPVIVATEEDLPEEKAPEGLPVKEELPVVVKAKPAPPPAVKHYGDPYTTPRTSPDDEQVLYIISEWRRVAGLIGLKGVNKVGGTSMRMLRNTIMEVGDKDRWRKAFEEPKPQAASLSIEDLIKNSPVSHEEILEYEKETMSIVTAENFAQVVNAILDKKEGNLL